jgi:hypothetical protein
MIFLHSSRMFPFMASAFSTFLGTRRTYSAGLCFCGVGVRWSLCQQVQREPTPYADGTRIRRTENEQV